MTQKLATLNAGSRPLDFGLQIVFDAEHGMRAEGRSDSGDYVGPYFSGLTAQDVTVSPVAADYEMPVPSPEATPTTYAESALAFKRRFTMAERIAIRALAKTDPIVADFMDLLDTAGATVGNVHFADPDLIAGVGYFENVAHIISAGRAAEILTP